MRQPESRSHTQHGFTLIELMLVLVIIGIATAAIGVAVRPTPGAALRQDALDLARRLIAAQNEARIDGRLIAWVADEQGYRFMRGTWRGTEGSAIPSPSLAGELDAFADDDILRPRRWSEPPTEVSPTGPLRLSPEWIAVPLTLQLRSGSATARIVLDAGGYRVE